MRSSGVVLLLATVTCGYAAVDAYAADPNPPSIRSDRGAWPIRRQWTPAETDHFAKWVQHLYTMKIDGTIEQRMGKVIDMMTDRQVNLLEDPSFLGEGGNPQLPSGLLRQMNSMIDCGKFTAFIPAYYAYRRALPWMTTHVRSGGGDVRTADFNIPTGCTNSFLCSSPQQFFSNAVGGFISGNYRVELYGTNSQLSDTVPVAIDSNYLKPGCINYIDGHCLILADATPYGELRFINASTTVTRDIYTYNGMNTVYGLTPEGDDPSNPWKGCYQGLRVLRYPIAETDSRGRVTKVRRRTDDEMREFGFSTEQYTLMSELMSNRFIQEGQFKPSSYHDLIRLRMKTVDSIAPLHFLEEYADELVEAYRFREEFVQAAWRNVRAEGPIAFPDQRSNENIFQAFGRWETWSSPSSDVDRRNKYFYLGEWLDYAIRMFGMMPEFVDLTGLEKYQVYTQADLARALIAEKNRVFREKYIHYTNSKGEQVKLTLEDIEERIYDFSFDPNHPPELRWGAPIDSLEFAGAPKLATPVPTGSPVPLEEAYRLQRYYRTVGQRETEMSMLRGMFTEGFPMRAKLEGFLDKWYTFTQPTEALVAWLPEDAVLHAAGVNPATPGARPAPATGIVSSTPISFHSSAATTQVSVSPVSEPAPERRAPRSRISPRRDEPGHGLRPPNRRRTGRIAG